MAAINTTLEFKVTEATPAVQTEVMKLPELPFDAAYTAHFVLDDLTGGTNPKVTTEFEFSNDGISWVDGDTALQLGRLVMDSGSTNAFYKDKASGSKAPISGFHNFVYARLTAVATGDGGDVFETWTLKVHLSATYSRGQ